MNQGWAQRYRDLADVDVADAGGRVGISLVHSRADTMPVRLRLLERHPLGSQIFMPLSAHPFLVVVGVPGPTSLLPYCALSHAEPPVPVLVSPSHSADACPLQQTPRRPHWSQFPSCSLHSLAGQT